MLGCYQPQEGHIALDGKDIRYLAANELRSVFGVVPQDTVLFSGTLYENLVMAHPHASFDDVIAACSPAPRYGVTYDDISTREERDYWIAGSWLKVIDLKTNEVVAERIGYMMDRGQGNTSGGRAPWLLAADNACPSFFRNPNLPPNGHGSRAQSRQAQDFVEKTLKPRLEK